MTSFSIHFILCNLFIALVILTITAVKYLFKNHLSARTVYRLWSVLFILMALPFLPVRLPGLSQIFFQIWPSETLSKISGPAASAAQIVREVRPDWMNDFTVSAARETPEVLGNLCWILWLAGIFFMLIFQIRSIRKLSLMKYNAAPAAHPGIRRLFKQCCSELKITKIPGLYTTPLLKTPVMAGIFRAGIYLPEYLISETPVSSLRHIFLHELTHYKQKDAWTGVLMNLFLLLYWPNPFVWFAINEIRSDREIACDAVVLKAIGEENALDYGNTLLNLAEKISMDFSPFAPGLSGNMRQMTRRIRHIAAYRCPTKASFIKSLCIGTAAATLLLSLSPVFSAFALYPASGVSSLSEADVRLSDGDRTKIDFSEINLSSYFGDMDGTFVFYDLSEDTWQIYNKSSAFTRVSPDSTYKIYSALFALDAGIITPDDSKISWNGKIYTYDVWNKDQNLDSAMENSVNWYFQTLETMMGKAALRQYIEAIHYGNEDLSGEFPSCWLESSLKISPVEQVYLLKETFGGQSGSTKEFDASHINAVKNALYLYDIPGGSLYGKTGTGNIDNHNIRGWFVGFAEYNGHTCCFATHIEAPDNAAGSQAAQITLAILSDFGITH